MAYSVGSRADKKKKKKKWQNQASSCPVCCFYQCLTEGHSLTTHCWYSGKLTSVIESFWKLSGCYLHWKARNPNHLTSRKHRKPQKYLQVNFNTRREHFKPLDLPIWIHSRLHTSLALPITQTVWAAENMFTLLHFSSQCTFHKTITAVGNRHGPAPAETPLSVTAEANLTGQGQVTSLEIQGSIQVIRTCKKSSATLHAHRRCY